MDGQKMSKTLGNVVAPSEIINAYGVDAFRYYFLRHIPSYNDGDFSWTKLHAVYTSELGNELGNAAQRVTAMIQKYQNSIIGDIPKPEHDAAQYHDAIAECRFDRALDEVWEKVRGLNQYIDESKPWEIAKTKDEDHLREVLANCVGSLLQIAELLMPFLPETAGKIRYSFNEGVVRPLDGSLFPRLDPPVGAVAEADAKAAQPSTVTPEAKPKA
jgi:methionyl-tRNA synthetase